jgi:hypothetical protein
MGTMFALCILGVVMRWYPLMVVIVVVLFSLKRIILGLFFIFEWPTINFQSSHELHIRKVVVA